MFRFKRTSPALFSGRVPAFEVISWTQKDFVQQFFKVDETLSGVVAVRLGRDLATAIEAQSNQMQPPLRTCQVKDYLCYLPSDEQRVYDLHQIVRQSFSAQTAKEAHKPSLAAQTASAKEESIRSAEEHKKKAEDDETKALQFLVDGIWKGLKEKKDVSQKEAEVAENANTEAQSKPTAGAHAPQVATENPQSPLHPTGLIPLKTYAAYNQKQFGIPWGAPCDPATGHPCFDGAVAHYTGTGGSSGTLFVDSPEEGSVWVYGQRDYHKHTSGKAYAVFQHGSFHPLSEKNLFSALATAPKQAEGREKQLLKILFEELQSAEAECRVPCTTEILARRGITPEEASKYGNIRLQTPTEDI